MSSVHTSINLVTSLAMLQEKKNSTKGLFCVFENMPITLTIQNYSCSLVQVIKLLLCNFINRKEANDQLKNNNNEKKVLSADQI